MNIELLHSIFRLAAIIAIAIPLSFEIVSRISERYQSEVISKNFFKEWYTKWLTRLLIIDIIFVIISRFFVSKNFEKICWVLLAWINLLLFISIVFVFAFYIKNLKKYISDPDFILKKLFKDAENAIK